MGAKKPDTTQMFMVETLSFLFLFLFHSIMDLWYKFITLIDEETCFKIRAVNESSQTLTYQVQIRLKFK